MEYKEQHKLKLKIPMLGSLSKVRYVEQEIEKHLGSIDRDVLEEVKVSFQNNLLLLFEQNY